jgi:hypothetical protein
MPKKEKAEGKKEVSSSPEKLKGRDYLRELERLHVELVKLAYADQAERDHAALKAAVRAGKIDVHLEA